MAEGSQERCTSQDGYKCLPLNKNQKLRYPNTEEMELCFDNLLLEFFTIQPKVVFLLGAKVTNFVNKKLQSKSLLTQPGTEILNKITFLNIYHPSYVHIYRRKFINDYKQEIINKIDQNLL
jgi:uracil-DNA glycosylase